MKHTAKSKIGKPFADVLLELVSNPPAGSEKMKITPEMAGEMLQLNTRNRPVAQKKVEEYAGQMAKGQWRYTRVPIIFSDEGRVIDGQHRLLACLESGVPIECDVAFGAPDDSFAFIDIGKKRSAGDIFAINGVPNHASAAAMTKVIFFINAGSNSNGTGKDIPSLSELYEYYLTLPRLQDSMKVVNWFAQSRLATPSIMGAVHYLCAQKNRAQADQFFDEVCHGAPDKSFASGDLHKALIRAAISTDRWHKNKLTGMTIQHWNRMRRGLSGRGVKVEAYDKLPAVL